MEGLVGERGYSMYDIFRPRLWDNERVEWWYAQNMFLYVRRGVGERFAGSLPAEGWALPARAIHPRHRRQKWEGRLRALGRARPSRLIAECRSRLARVADLGR